MLVVCRSDIGPGDFERLEARFSGIQRNLRWARRGGRLVLFIEDSVPETGELDFLADDPAVDYVLTTPSADEIARIFSRRDLLDLALAGTGLVAAATLLGPIGAYLATPADKRSVRGDVFVGRADAIPVGEAQRRIVEGEEYIIVRRDETRFYALAATCTHSEVCTVDWDAKRRQLVCPCHRGIFDLQGNVIAGPPPRPLARREAVIREGNLFLRGSGR
ncbi:MAG: QcrA and Rieske domain-containing protein [Planctomycetota bacterium]|jgi:cytochrome b6-f complex iron-sulfur subunit